MTDFFAPPRQYPRQLVYIPGHHGPAGYGWVAWLPRSTWQQITDDIGCDPAYVRETLAIFAGVDPVAVTLESQDHLQGVKRALMALERRRVQTLMTPRLWS